MRRLRKILKWSAATLLGLVLTLVILGYIFEDKIHLYAIRELGKSLNARIEVQETNVSFIRSWPAVNLELEGLRINPVGSSNGEDVISVASANFRIDFWSVFTDRFEISAVRLVRPRMKMIIDEEGNSNLADMFQPERDSSAGRSEKEDVHFELEKVRFTDGSFAYDDLRSGMKVRLDSIYLQLKGDLSGDKSEVKTDFALRLAQWKDKEMTWVRDKHLKADLLLDAVFGEGESYKIKEGTVNVAALELGLLGDVKRTGKDYFIDLNYRTNQNSFAAFMSLLPGGLLDAGREYEYSGDFSVKGWMRGLAGPGHAPDIGFDYAVENGAFQYVGYDARLSEVRLNGNFLLEQDAPTASIFKVDDFHARLSQKALEGSLTYQDFSNPRLSFALKGDVNLGDIRDFYPKFAEKSNLQGDVGVDVFVEGRIADFREKRYQQIKAQGGVKFTQLRIEDPALDHPIENLDGQIRLDNRRIQVARLSGKVGNSDFDLKGTVSDYLPRLFGEESLVKGRLELISRRLDLNDWLLAEASAPGNASNSSDRFAYRLPKGVDFEIRADIASFQLADFQATSVIANCHLHGQQVNLHQLTLNSLEGSMSVTGKLAVLSQDRCHVQLDAHIQDIDVHKGCTSFHQLAAFALVENNLFGRFSGDVNISGDLNQYLVLDPASLNSYGTVEMRNGQLKDFTPLEGLAGFVKIDELRDVRFSDVRTGYRIDEQNFYIPRLKVTANRYNLEVVGRHGFDNSLDYKVYVELPRKEARKSRNKNVLEFIETDEGDPIRVVIPVHITGTVDHPKYALEGKYVKERVAVAVKKQGTDLKEGWKTETKELFGSNELPEDRDEVSDLIEVEEVPKDTSKKSLFENIKLKNPLKKIRLPQFGGKKR
jgi:hypothetical protein